MVDLHLCTGGEIAAVERFLDRHWSEGHILSRHRALMDWQHRAADRDGHDFVVATDGDEVLGILGFIRNSRYDPALAERDTVWLTTWKVREDCGVAGLGLMLHRHLVDHVGAATAIGTVGNNAAVEPVYRALGFATGKLERYYVLNPEVGRFRLARVAEAPPPAVPDPTLRLEPVDAESLRRLDSGDVARLERAVPAKTPAYFAGRYFDHPIYDYRVLGLARGGRIQALMAIRTAEHAGATALRVVDLLGPADAWRGCGAALAGELARTGAEYADLYAFGPDPASFEAAGLARLAPDSRTTLPGHFEPFEPGNVNIRFAFRATPAQPFTLFRADADQDRPNQVP